MSQLATLVSRFDDCAVVPKEHHVTPMRWLLVLQTRPTYDETAFAYQFALYELDEPSDQPVVVSSLDDLLTALLARRARLPEAAPSELTA